LPVVAVLVALGCGKNGTTPPGGGNPTPGDAFLRARGTAIVDGDGNPVFLRGVSFGNEVWTNVALPNDHAEIDFQRLADMGANSTRFLLNYVTFEDDAAPYVYKDAGWAWIDQNITWAKAHGIRLILNIHVPPGGFQSNGGGGALWNDVANQDRLTALWKEIGRRYADQPTIVGFGLLNEPEPVSSRQQWQALAARILTAIRSVDGNHIIFVEPAIAVGGDFSQGASMNQFKLDDANVVYEFHFYEPYEYTSQLEPWANLPDVGGYPDPTRISGVTETWLNLATFDAPTAPAGTSDWTHYEGTRITASSSAIAAGKPTLVGQALGAGTIAFDDLTINEYDATGTFTREIEHIYPTATDGWYFWSNNNVGIPGTTSDCETSATCLTITGTTDDANFGGSTHDFSPRPGYQYSVSGWMKGTNLPAGAIALIRLDMVGSSTTVGLRDKAGVAALMAPFLNWGKNQQVPLFLGEFGVYKACFAPGKGGLAWVNDAYDLATGDGGASDSRVAGLSYHQYHEDSFALYYGGGPVDPSNANQPLIDLLTAKLHAAP
jgi:endoglucanase